MKSGNRYPWLLLGGLAAASAGLVLVVRRWILRRRRRIEQVLPPASEDQIRTQRIVDSMTDEVIQAFGFPIDGWQHQVLGPLLSPAARSFAGMLTSLDRYTGTEGLGAAFGRLLRLFVSDIQAVGAEKIPPTGPVMIITNHPGAYDGPSIAASLPREDLHIVISTVPFFDEMSHVESHLIQVTREAHDGMRGVRQSIRHLKSGGALLTFASGIVDPDPDVLPGAHEALEDWSPSIGVILRRVPETQVVVTIVSGVLSPRWLTSPIVKIQPETWRQRKLAEILQVMHQVIFPGSLLLTPRISFASPITAAELSPDGDAREIQRQLIERAQALLVEHMAWSSTSSMVS
ncbi:MAG: hypothetical protein U9R25_14385 [Chloroflexota bacterium]|nr:hypothetical protein [Chloroflexota bacterium]